jgi:hypothetical protein
MFEGKYFKLKNFYLKTLEETYDHAKMFYLKLTSF